MTTAPTTTQNATQTLVMEREFNATPEQLWAAWTDPKILAKWISPFPGLDAEIHELDARPCGRVRFTMTGPDGTRYPEALWYYVVLERPHKIIQFEPNENRPDLFNGYPMRHTIRFEAAGKKARVVMEVMGMPPTMPLEMARGGFGSCLNKLEALLAAKTA
ncbi:MAG TPA: SRPBCC domain-containing protein [Candidatus Thermoplasmatota archaeon]|nr:SRPBCC domain-containing protein [Candidatus Thermoplasmatota archaeon]